jgi:hypothetical protein
MALFNKQLTEITHTEHLLFRCKFLERFLMSRETWIIFSFKNCGGNTVIYKMMQLY